MLAKKDTKKRSSHRSPFQTVLLVSAPWPRLYLRDTLPAQIAKSSSVFDLGSNCTAFVGASLHMDYWSRSVSGVKTVICRPAEDLCRVYRPCRPRLQHFTGIHSHTSASSGSVRETFRLISHSDSLTADERGVYQPPSVGSNLLFLVMELCGVHTYSWRHTRRFCDTPMTSKWAAFCGSGKVLICTSTI